MKILFVILIVAASFLLLSCATGGSTSATAGKAYVVFAWNDLGMHCLNPTYDTAVLLPPYNTVWAQVIKRGNPPQVVTTGISVEYRIINNTASYTKTYGDSKFGQFWDNCLALFGVSLAHDKGLNLEDPLIHNGLSGAMVAKIDHFQVNGIPVTPVDDAGKWNPYQVAEITVKDGAGKTLEQTKAMVPTSDEINCFRCHGGANATETFTNILTSHDADLKTGPTTLETSTPVLCAECHGSPALGTSGPGTSKKYLSQAIHGFHAAKPGVTCYHCHPGPSTQCSRSLRHTAADGNCIACHGDMANVASSIDPPPTGTSRIPWVNEPKCVDCHSAAIPQVDTGITLYRNDQGHGNLYCAACHQSPHAMIPSRQDADNYQAVSYQGSPKSIGSCGACHPEGSKGSPNFGDFVEAHGGTGYEEANACHVCHTVIPTPVDTAKWPHQFQWKNR